MLFHCKRTYSVIALCIIMLLTLNHPAFADTTTVLSPGYRVKSTLDENKIGYQAITATLILPSAADIKGVKDTGATYNYLGLETAGGNSIEIGLHKDYFDLANGKWSVFSYANYAGAFANYGSNERWHNFRIMPWSPQGPDMTFADGSKVTMTLKVVNNNEAVFEVTGFEPIVLKLPMANPEGKEQIFRRVTSIMTDDVGGFSRNNQWEEVKLLKPNEDFVLWVPSKEEILKSNNMDQNDPNGSSVTVKTGQYYPEIVDIRDLKPMEQVKRLVVKFTLGETSYLINDFSDQMDAAPYTDHGRTLIPVRYLAQALGASDIQWDETTGTVTLNKGESVITLVVGQQNITTPTGQVAMDVSPQVKEGRIYLPARYVAEAFGYYASWDEESRTVTIQ